MSAVQDMIEEFRSYVKEIDTFNEVSRLLGWDIATMTPSQGISRRAEVLGMIQTHTFKMLISDKVAEFIQFFSEKENEDQLDDVTKRMVSELKKEYDRNKKVPAEMFQEFTILTAKGEQVWKEAREKSDFSLFAPTLTKIVEFYKKFAELWGYEGHPYNALLNNYESGLTVEKVDKIFADLRASLVPLVQKISASTYKPDGSILEREYNKDQQKEFVTKVIGQLGFNFNAGRLDVSSHPFAQMVNPDDVRLTTRYNVNNLRSALFGAIHESGHGMYDQNLSKDLVGTGLADGASMSIHESQSRFWENIVGRSLGFWKYFYPQLVETFPEALKDVPLEDFYRAVNEVKPSYIRVEADEVTYNLHIMIRYEIEKALFGGEIEIEELPRIWNQKFEEYLGIVPPNDPLGVLQDIHWANGLFGYFPSYSLGNIYGAQFTHAMKKALPDFNQLIEKGEFKPILNWLVEQIHSKGRMKDPLELLKEVTGEELNATYLVKYLEEKMRDVYRI